MGNIKCIIEWNNSQYWDQKVCVNLRLLNGYISLEGKFVVKLKKNAEVFSVVIL